MILQENIKSKCIWTCEGIRGGGIRTAHETIQIILEMFSLSFCTLSSDLYEMLDSVRSDPTLLFCSNLNEQDTVACGSVHTECFSGHK